MKKYFSLTICSLIFAPTLSLAQLDAADQQALQSTQKLLTSPEQRNAAIKKDPKAISADKYAKSVGGENTEEIYALTSKVFEKLLLKYNGDASKIAEVIERAAKDPAGFASSEFSAEELKALKELASKRPMSGYNK